MTAEGLTMLVDYIESMSRVKLSEKQIQAWRFMLAEDDDARVLNRLRQFYRSPEAGKRKEKIPTPGDLIDQPESRQDAAHLAWATVRQAIGDHGSYTSVDFHDGAISATVDALGGWVELCNKDSKELDMLAWQFSKIYPTFHGKVQRKILSGRHDALNTNGHGKELQAPLSIPTLGSAPPMAALEGQRT